MSALAIRTAQPPGELGRSWPLYGCGGLAYLGMLGASARRVTADGYDGVGFVLSLSRFDLGRWQPQPPGYPLLVVAGRAAVALGLRPAVALAAVNAGLLGAGLLALAWGVRRIAGPAAGLVAALLLPAAPLAFALALSTLSDAAGLGALLLAAALLVRPGRLSTRRLFACGCAAGLALGVRPAQAPLAALLLLVLGWLGGWRAAALAALSLLLASLLWLVPLAAVVGPWTLWELSQAHVHGHFADYGGAVVTDPRLGPRLAALLTTGAAASFGPLGLGWGALGALALAVQPSRCWASPVRRLAGALLALAAGSGLWVLLALPVHGHARHLLPLTVALLALAAVAIGQALAVARPAVRGALGLGTALALSGLWLTSARTAWAVRSRPAPAAALAEYVVAHFPRGTAVYGTRAARSLDALVGSGSARPARYLGEVIADAQSRGPGSVLLTSEVQVATAASARLILLERFCYDAAVPLWLRLDRATSDCVTLFAYRVTP